MTRTDRARCAAAVALVAIGCGAPSPPAGTATTPDAAVSPSPRSADPAAPAPPSPAEPTPPADGLAATLLEALRGAAGSGPTTVEADGDCSILYPPPDDEIAAERGATVPLVPGLTLSHLWRTVESVDEFECLAHVESVDGEAVQTSNTCLRGAETPPVSFARRTCRADMRRAHVYQTMVGSSTPETIRGATSYSLSREAFGELKRSKTTAHQYIELTFKQGGPIQQSVFQAKLEGALSLEGTGTLTTIVNDAPTDLPVLRLSGTVRGTWYGKSGESRVHAAVLDDERFPLVLEYRLLDLGEHEFSVRYTKVSYPTSGALEKRLEEAKRVDVYGIYFDFASDQIRKESEPVLREIAGILQKNADWTLHIAGHTDSVGSDAANLDLSQRRSAAVRTALVQRFAIAADRLSTAGHGEAAPKDTNDTPEGRARNRRVELVRQ